MKPLAVSFNYLSTLAGIEELRQKDDLFARVSHCEPSSLWGYDDVTIGVQRAKTMRLKQWAKMRKI